MNICFGPGKKILPAEPAATEEPMNEVLENNGLSTGDVKQLPPENLVAEAYSIDNQMKMLEHIEHVLHNRKKTLIREIFDRKITKCGGFEVLNMSTVKKDYALIATLDCPSMVVTEDRVHFLSIVKLGGEVSRG